MSNMPITLTHRASIEVSEQAIAEARKAGIFGNVAKRLARMARRSAPLTHPKGNRRFDDFVLLVKDRTVLSVSRF